VIAKVFSPLGRNGINVKAISQGSSELNISIAINESDLKKALRVLHQSLFRLELQQLHLYIAGLGSVGERLLSMIAAQKSYLESQKIRLKICGLSNSRRMLLEEQSIDATQWKQKFEEDFEKADLKKFTHKLVEHNLENSVFIDITASDEPILYYEGLLTKNIAIVAANKRANTQSMMAYRTLKEASRKRNVPFHYETNVGAGLPIINALRSLMVSGDTVVRIEAVLSGTLNYLSSEYDGSKSFSDLVREAKEIGYTEPDPRDDLSGMDVARKCLILARECGWDIELDDIVVEPMMPEASKEAKDVPSFFETLHDYNEVFNQRYQEAQVKNKKLRYVAVIEHGSARVALTEVDQDHAFYSLKGTENCISLTTKYYQKYPMVIKGPGAGIDVTAAGVLADIVRIAEGLRT
jgi:aspartokinase/homoserine dehydrogenase 1